MTAGSGRRRRDRSPDLLARPGPGDPGLTALGVHRGEQVRWQARPGGRWQEGLLSRREPDGSIGVVDGSGRARSLTLDRLEIRWVGTRGGLGWEPLTVRAGRAEQLTLFA
ncbi:MAG: hypothetical protein M3Y91_07730 [Actinomycetota bacterium]|nr:hypothetical protein [Actinomycetota bacterium]